MDEFGNPQSPGSRNMARIKHVSSKHEPQIAVTTTQLGFPALNALACGLFPQGLGGQHGYFGLWLDSDFGRGHSRARPKCTTYGSPRLSAEEDFSLDSVEVWAVGKPPEPEDVEHLHLIYFYTLASSVSSQTLNLPHCPADFTIVAFFLICVFGDRVRTGLAREVSWIWIQKFRPSWR